MLDLMFGKIPNEAPDRFGQFFLHVADQPCRAAHDRNTTRMALSGTPSSARMARPPLWH